MLDRLMVKDLALIEKSVVEFGPGLEPESPYCSAPFSLPWDKKPTRI